MAAKKNPTNLKDMLEILGNRDDEPWPMFSDKSSARVSTINLGEHRAQNNLKYFDMEICFCNHTPSKTLLKVT